MERAIRVLTQLHALVALLHTLVDVTACATVAAQAVARVTLADVTSTCVLTLLAAVIEGVVAAFIDVNTDGGLGRARQ